MNRILSLAALVVAAFAAGGCATCCQVWNHAEAKPADIGASARLGLLSASLADQLLLNSDLSRIAESRIAVATFSNLPTLAEADKIGLAMEERMTHEMQTRGFRVVDYKVTGKLRISERGDFLHSRHMADLKRDYGIAYFLTGVIENSVEGFVIHARLIDSANNNVVSSAQGFLAAGDGARLLRDFKLSDAPRIIIDMPAPAKPAKTASR